VRGRAGTRDRRPVSAGFFARIALAASSGLVPLIAPAAHGAWGDAVRAGGYARESVFLWRQPAAATGAPGSDELTSFLHTRENLRAYLTPALTLGVELKTRYVAGGGARELVDLADRTGTSHPYFNWERRFVNRDQSVLVSALDRAWLEATAGPADLTVGRQRIAWGTALVWNPVDLFNPSSPLDFDNEEKPGTDGARLRIYTGPDSRIEFAAVPARHADDASGAAEVVVNRAGYDWIALGGRRGPTAVMGGGWAGSIRGGGFRGEFLYAIARAGYVVPGTINAERSRFAATIDGDCTFASSLYLHGAVLFNDRGATGAAGGERLLDAERRGWLSPARISLFAEVARDLHPLVRADLAGILDPYDGSAYLGPTLVYSLATDLDLTLSGLFFTGAPGTEFGDAGEIGMSRIKWSF